MLKLGYFISFCWRNKSGTSRPRSVYRAVRLLQKDLLHNEPEGRFVSRGKSQCVSSRYISSPEHQSSGSAVVKRPVCDDPLIIPFDSFGFSCILGSNQSFAELQFSADCKGNPPF